MKKGKRPRGLRGRFFVQAAKKDRPPVPYSQCCTDEDLIRHGFAVPPAVGLPTPYR